MQVYGLVGQTEEGIWKDLVPNTLFQWDKHSCKYIHVRLI